MNRLTWEFRRWMVHPWAGFAVFSICAIVAGLIFLLVVKPAEMHLKAEKQASLHRQAAWKNSPPPKPGVNTVAQVMARFPVQSDVPKWLSSIFTAARDMNVDLELGQYTYAKERGTNLARYQIEMPVTAPYPTVRALVARLMNQMPFAALDDLVVTKELPEDEDVNATLRLSIFVRGDGR